MNKDKAIVILAVLSVLLFVLNIGSCINASNQNALRKKEMLQRLDVEEKTSKTLQERTGLAEKLAAREKELDEARVTIEAAKRALAQEQMNNISLKEELDKVVKLKDALQEELKKRPAKKAKKMN